MHNYTKTIKFYRLVSNTKLQCLFEHFYVGFIYDLLEILSPVFDSSYAIR
jgi:hypothetical protein